MNPWGWSEDLQGQPQDTAQVLKRTPQPRASPRAGTPLPTCPGTVSPQDPCCCSPLPHARLGRRKLLILNYLQTAVSGTCAAFAPNFPVYCAFRLLSGMSLAGIALNCMTLSEGGREGRAGPYPLLSDPQPSSLFPAPSPSQPLLSPACPHLGSQPNSLLPRTHTILTCHLGMIANSIFRARPFP